MCGILQHFMYLQQKCQCAEFYTDASKMATSVFCDAHGPGLNLTKPLNNITSTFTAGLKVYILLLIIYFTVTFHDPFSIDSLSVVREYS